MTRRRFLASLLALCVAFLPLTSDALLFQNSTGKQMVSSGSVTQANIRISAVDGTAFVDFSAANVLTGKIGNELHIADSAGNEIIGIIKAVGTAEGLGDESITAWTNDARGGGTYGYET
jgi:hypothetical protein